MTEIPPKLTARRRERHKRVKLASAAYLKLRRERRKAHGVYQQRRAEWREVRDDPDVDPADAEELRAALLAARERFLNLQHDEDEARDKLAAAKAALARTIKAIRTLRRAPKPGELITRAQWGAAPPRGALTRNSTIVKQVIHHTAYPALSPTASIAEESAKMREIQRGHFARGFTDLGYHRVVFPSGRVYEGRASWAVGAHTLGENTGSTAASCDGNFEVSQPTDAMVAGAKRALAGLPGSGTQLYGHYQLNPTACPGKNLKPKIGAIE